MTGECARAEVLAGAIALGEASDVERDQYRLHVAACRRCVNAFGGEREIERTANVVALARDGETWQPDLRGWMTSPQKRRALTWRFGLSGAAAVVISLGIHALVAANISVSAPSNAEPATVALGSMQVTLERRPPAERHKAPDKAPAAARAAAPRLEVVHNVVTLHRPTTPVVVAQVASRIVATPKPVRIETKPQAQHAIVAMVPSQRDERSISALKTAATAAPPAAHAESMAIVPPVTVIHDAMPIGGESAIAPHPSDIWYSEGAEGTTAFSVLIDDKGAPVKCTITKSAGYLVLDEAVCKAAMRVRYSPKTINGHAVSGVYEDAVIFRQRQ